MAYLYLWYTLVVAVAAATLEFLIREDVCEWSGHCLAVLAKLCPFTLIHTLVFESFIKPRDKVTAGYSLRYSNLEPARNPCARRPL